MMKLYTLFGLLVTCLTTVISADRGLRCSEKPCSCCRTGKCVETNDGVLQCDGCVDGYMGLRCEEPCPEHCYNCSQHFYLKNERICYLCHSGYYNGVFQDIKDQPFQHDCRLRCEETCSECRSFKNCTLCKQDNYLTDGGTCEQCPSNCKECLPGKGCVACNDRYVLTGAKCQPCSVNCIKCMFKGECRECDLGYYLEDGGCIQCRKGCLSCEGILKCSKCQEGYFLVGSDCQVCQGSCVDCALNEMNQFVCMKCRNGFFLLNATCRECPAGCLICKSKDCCEVCDLGYTLYDKSCHKCSKSCISCSSVDNCSECKPMFYLKKGVCYQCPENCTSCVRENDCGACKDGFWGNTCNEPCSKGCIDNKCNNKNGACLKGCLLEFSGANCSTGPTFTKSRNSQEVTSTYVILVSITSSAITGVMTVFLTYMWIKRKDYLIFFRRHLPSSWLRRRSPEAETQQRNRLSRSVEVYDDSEEFHTMHADETCETRFDEEVVW